MSSVTTDSCVAEAPTMPDRLETSGVAAVERPTELTSGFGTCTASWPLPDELMGAYSKLSTLHVCASCWQLHLKASCHTDKEEASVHVCTHHVDVYRKCTNYKEHTHI